MEVRASRTLLASSPPARSVLATALISPASHAATVTSTRRDPAASVLVRCRATRAVNPSLVERSVISRILPETLPDYTRSMIDGSTESRFTVRAHGARMADAAIDGAPTRVPRFITRTGTRGRSGKMRSPARRPGRAANGVAGDRKRLNTAIGRRATAGAVWTQSGLTRHAGCRGCPRVRLGCSALRLRTPPSPSTACIDLARMNFPAGLKNPAMHGDHSPPVRHEGVGVAVDQ